MSANLWSLREKYVGLWYVLNKLPNWGLNIVLVRFLQINIEKWSIWSRILFFYHFAARLNRLTDCYLIFFHSWRSNINIHHLHCIHTSMWNACISLSSAEAAKFNHQSIPSHTYLILDKFCNHSCNTSSGATLWNIRINTSNSHSRANVKMGDSVDTQRS